MAFLPIVTRGCWSNADVLIDAPNAVLDPGKITMELNCVYVGTVNVKTDIRDYYAISLQAGNAYTIRLYDWSPPASGASDLDLFLRSSVGPDYPIVNRSEGTTGVETIQYTPPTSGVYFVIPQAYSTTQTTTYHLTATQP